MALRTLAVTVMDWKKLITADPAILHGAVRFEGTRIPVTVVLDNLADGAAPLHTAGLRGPDMAVRLKYAGVDPARIVAHPPDDLRGALLAFVRAAPSGATLYVLPTYTAMLDFRRALADLGAVKDFWRQ